MKKSGFTDSQIVATVALHEMGQKGADIFREYGIRRPSFCSVCSFFWAST